MGPNGAIRDYTNGGSTMYFDVSVGGTGQGQWIWRSSSTYATRMYLDTASNLTVYGNIISSGGAFLNGNLVLNGNQLYMNTGALYIANANGAGGLFLSAGGATTTVYGALSVLQNATFPASTSIGSTSGLNNAGGISTQSLRLNGGGGNNTLQWYDSAAGADQKFAELYSDNAGTFIGRFVNDVYNSGPAWLTVGRGANAAIGAVNLYGSSITLNAGVNITGVLTAGATQSFAASGYTKLPGGMIIQWALVGSNSTWTFPIAFPTACVAVNANINSANGTVVFASVVSSLSTTSAVITSRYATGTAIGTPGETVYVHAIGY